MGSQWIVYLHTKAESESSNNISIYKINETIPWGKMLCFVAIKTIENVSFVRLSGQNFLTKWTLGDNTALHVTIRRFYI